MRGKINANRAGSMLWRSAVPILTIMMLIAAVVPAYAGDTAVSLSNSSVSTYIIVFNDTPQAKMMSPQSTSNLIASYGGAIKYSYSIINGMAITIPDSQADLLESLPNVMYVEKDQAVHVLLNDSIPIIGADQVWNEGYKGAGVKVCVIDTGVDASHPDLNNGKVILWKDFVNSKTTPYDDHGHGTHVSGIIAGTGNASGGKYTGVAPDASLMEAKVLNSAGSGYDSNIIAAIQWAVNNHAQVISMSLGSDVHDTALDNAVNNAVSAGVVVVVAAGNSGPGSGTINSPGDADGAITVGAVYKNDTIAPFSSRGPAYGNTMKPDVTNIGVNVIAARASYNGIPNTLGKPVNDYPKYYMYLSGTSMATPMTSGVVALMLQKNASLTPVQVKSILESTTKPMGGTVPNYDYGYGRVQAKYAVDNVTGNQTLYNSAYISDTLPGTMQSGQASTLSITLENTGVYNWSRTNNTYLQGSLDASQFGPTEIDLPADVVVCPGGQYTWSIPVTVPSAPGSYNLSYRMSNSSSPFGDTLNKTIRVKDTIQPGTIQFHNATYTVLRSSGKATIQVDRVNSWDNAVSVYYSTVDGTSGNGTSTNTAIPPPPPPPPGFNPPSYDYVPANGTLIFEQDQANATFNVTIETDTYYKGNRTINLTLSNVTGGADLGNCYAVVNVIDDASRPAISFNSSQYSTTRSLQNYTVTVTCPNNYYCNVSVNYIIGGGNATPDVEYLPATGTLNFSGLNKSNIFNVTILANDSSSSDKTINLTLSDPSNSSVLGNNKTATLVIINNNHTSNVTINLVKGWNLISVPLNVSNTSVLGFFPQIVLGNMEVIWGWNESIQNWVLYSADPNDGFYHTYAKITHVEAGRAYWVYMDENESFSVVGYVPVGAPAGVSPLVSTWNFVGPTGLDKTNVTSLYNGTEAVWGWNESIQNWVLYSPDPNDDFYHTYSKITQVAPGHGYWVYMP